MKWAARIGVVLLVLCVAAVSAQPISAAQAAQVEPASGPAGTTFTFRAGGFDDHERVGYWLNAPNGTILAIGGGGAKASGGQVAASWTARAGVPAGWWQFVAQGVDSHVQQVVSFEVTAGGDAAAGSAHVEPRSGAAGTTFAFAATGFAAGERVGYWLNAPTGAVIAIDDYDHYANGDGRFDARWGALADAAPGTWQLVAQGATSGVLHVIAFDIR
jgi:hypothetical protein